MDAQGTHSHQPCGWKAPFLPAFAIKNLEEKKEGKGGGVWGDDGAVGKLLALLA